MGSNRKQPFGYRMEMGRIVPNPAELSAVRNIFTEYEKGASFKELAEAMAEKATPYDGDKPWNKNMIARILADARYTGAEGFPQIIVPEQYESVARKRSKKSSQPQRTDAQKLLRRKCRTEVTPDAEMEVLRQLNSLCKDCSLIHSPATQTLKSETMASLEDEVGEQLQALPVNESGAKQAIFQLAAAQYEAIGNEEYETQRLRRIFQNREPTQELDANLIKNTVSEIIVATDGSVSIRLKNNQIIGKR